MAKWLVTVYDFEDQPYHSWEINHRTEDEAYDEAAVAVATHWAGSDWTMTEVKEEDDA
jgi:hypothetical protein